jgi:hypothetical protein
MATAEPAVESSAAPVAAEGEQVEQVEPQVVPAVALPLHLQSTSTCARRGGKPRLLEAEEIAELKTQLHSDWTLAWLTASSGGAPAVQILRREITMKNFAAVRAVGLTMRDVAGAPLGCSFCGRREALPVAAPRHAHQPIRSRSPFRRFFTGLVLCCVWLACRPPGARRCEPVRSYCGGAEPPPQPAHRGLPQAGSGVVYLQRRQGARAQRFHWCVRCCGEATHRKVHSTRC